MELRRTLKRLAGVGVAVMFGATLLAGAATTAQASTPIYEVINANSSNSCLQVSGTGDPRNVILGTCDRSAKQIWTISGGVFRNPASGHCLDGNGADVYTHLCNGGAYQQWHTTGGSPTYISHDWSDYFLTSTGSVGAYPYFAPTMGTASRWVIHQVGSI